MIKKILILLFIISNIFALSPSQEYKLFSDKQKQVLKEAYRLGEPFNVGYTLSAIAWQESSCGLFLVNMQDPSAGVFHNNIKSVLRRHDIPETNFQINHMAQRLIDDMEFSASEALAELEFWQTIHGKNSWFLIWQSYNGGFSYVNRHSNSYMTSYQYAIKIKEKVDFLKKHLKDGG